MISIPLLTARHLGIDAISVEWELYVPNNEDTSSYSLELYRGEDLSELKLIAKPSINTEHFEDFAVDTRSRNRFNYYLLRAIDSTDSTSYVDATTTALIPNPDVIALDVVRSERLLLKWYLKTKVWFYQARTYGVRCYNCWDDQQNRRMKHDCPVCYGTTFQHGFFDPTPGYIDMTQHPNVIQAASFGPIAAQPSQSQAWTTNFPLLKVNDYMFEVDTGKRWKITQIGYNEKSRFITKQLLGIDEEMRGHIIYNIKTPTWHEPWY